METGTDVEVRLKRQNKAMRQTGDTERPLTGQRDNEDGYDVRKHKYKQRDRQEDCETETG